MTGFPSFLDWITLQCTYTPHIFIDSSAFGHWAVFLSCLLYTVQQWTWGCRSLLDILVLSLLDINSGVIAASYDIVFLVIFSGTSTVFHNGYAILIILIPTNRVQKFYFSTSLLASYIYIYIKCASWKVISPFDLVSISLILTDIEHFSYMYWSLQCLLWRNFYWSSLHIFLNSIICLLLFSSWVVLVSYIFCILDPYSVTKFADTSSHYIGCLLLIVEETILSSLGNFRTLIKIICPHMAMIQWQKKKKKNNLSPVVFWN